MSLVPYVLAGVVLLGILRALVFSQRAPEPDPRLGIPPGRSADA